MCPSWGRCQVGGRGRNESGGARVFQHVSRHFPTRASRRSLLPSACMAGPPACGRHAAAQRKRLDSAGAARYDRYHNKVSSAVSSARPSHSWNCSPPDLLSRPMSSLNMTMTAIRHEPALFRWVPRCDASSSMRSLRQRHERSQSSQDYVNSQTAWSPSTILITITCRIPGWYTRLGFHTARAQPILSVIAGRHPR